MNGNGFHQGHKVLAGGHTKDGYRIFIALVFHIPAAGVCGDFHIVEFQLLVALDGQVTGHVEQAEHQFALALLGTLNAVFGNIPESLHPVGVLLHEYQVFRIKGLRQRSSFGNGLCGGLDGRNFFHHLGRGLYRLLGSQVLCNVGLFSCLGSRLCHLGQRLCGSLHCFGHLLDGLFTSTGGFHGSLHLGGSLFHRLFHLAFHSLNASLGRNLCSLRRGLGSRLCGSLRRSLLCCRCLLHSHNSLLYKILSGSDPSFRYP